MRLLRYCSYCVYFGAVSAPLSAAAATYYVGPAGKPSAEGTSRGAPSSPQARLLSAAAGDTIVFLDGEYSEPMVLSRSGRAGAPITLLADAGATPLFRGTDGNDDDGVSASAGVSHYVIDGLWFESWRYGGIGLDWEDSVSDIVIRNCVSDYNQLNGIALYRATNVVVERSIASRNGYGPSSWSSNFNLWGIKGSQNVVRGNVAFHGIDTSSYQSDGNGFILDLTLDQGSASFENNLAFLNGGACISVTDSGGAKITHNTCFHNAQQAANSVNELNFGDTCRGGVDGINVAGKPWSFPGLSLRNNVAVPRANRGAISTYTCGGGKETFAQGANKLEAGDGNKFFSGAASSDFAPVPAGPLVDAGELAVGIATDIGFDARCIKLETDASKKKYAWWSHAPNRDYIRSIGGIAKCFVPRLRPQGAGTDIGAYELGGVLAPGGTLGTSGGGTTGGGAAPLPSAGFGNVGGSASSPLVGGAGTKSSPGGATGGVDEDGLSSSPLRRPELACSCRMAGAGNASSAWFVSAGALLALAGLRRRLARSPSRSCS